VLAGRSGVSFLLVRRRFVGRKRKKKTRRETGGEVWDWREGEEVAESEDERWRERRK
jgi:hypothetical protein